jgi:hypothetical protein
MLSASLHGYINGLLMIQPMSGISGWMRILRALTAVPHLDPGVGFCAGACVDGHLPAPDMQRSFKLTNHHRRRKCTVTNFLCLERPLIDKSLTRGALTMAAALIIWPLWGILLASNMYETRLLMRVDGVGHNCHKFWLAGCTAPLEFRNTAESKRTHKVTGKLGNVF